jgi:GNAT superfamily N-acetyltransferase
VQPGELAALCGAAMPAERLTGAELAHVCFGEGDEVVGDRNGAAAFTISRFGDRVAATILLVAVAPEEQGKGRGKQLLADVLDRARARGATSAHLITPIPRYLWPGIDVTNTAAAALVESLGFVRDAVGTNMTIATSFRRPPPEGVTVDRATTAALRFATQAYPQWVAELSTALERGTAVAARDPDGLVIGFGCHSCNRAGWLGPIATAPDLQHGGVGSAVVAALCADLDGRGFTTGEICWVSNIRFYGKCGATVSRVFQGGHLDLRP